MGRVRVRAGGAAALVAVAAATVLAVPAALHGAGPAAKPRKPETLTRWRKVGVCAHPKVSIPIHARPTVSSPKVAKLHSKTEDGFPEVYLVLTKQVMPDGRTWLKLAIPMRPNGTTGWVVRGAMGKLTRVRRWLVVDRRKLRARFYDHGRQLWSAPVGIGKPSTPTPNGLFWVREEFVLDNQVFYGPYAFGTSAYAKVSDWPGGGVVGVHGRSLPQLVPGRPSHGCIRMHNKDILWLARHMPVGTPISVTH
jgi:lipoprotein-anchoring transpeptidase ErfK/SrfK